MSKCKASYYKLIVLLYHYVSILEAYAVFLAPRLFFASLQTFV